MNSIDDAIFGSGDESHANKDDSFKILREYTSILPDDRIRQIQQYQTPLGYGVMMKKYNWGGTIDSTYVQTCFSSEEADRFYNLWKDNLD